MYWYTWLSTEGITASAFDYSGLRRVRGGVLLDAPGADASSRALARACRAARSASAMRVAAADGAYASGGVRDTSGGYGAVLAERPIRRLLLASLCGRVALLDAAARLRALRGGRDGLRAVTGALVAAFAVTSALAPVRGRIVDRHGARARCAAFALLVLGVGRAAGGRRIGRMRPAWTLIALGGLAGLVAPAARAVHAAGTERRCATAASCSSACTRWTRRARSRR